MGVAKRIACFKQRCDAFSTPGRRGQTYRETMFVYVDDTAAGLGRIESAPSRDHVIAKVEARSAVVRRSLGGSERREHFRLLKTGTESFSFFGCKPGVNDGVFGATLYHYCIYHYVRSYGLRESGKNQELRTTDENEFDIYATGVGQLKSRTHFSGLFFYPKKNKTGGKIKRFAIQVNTAQICYTEGLFQSERATHSGRYVARSGGHNFTRTYPTRTHTPPLPRVVSRCLSLPQVERLSIHCSQTHLRPPPLSRH